jgi:hypothetical protein
VDPEDVRRAGIAPVTFLLMAESDAGEGRTMHPAPGADADDGDDGVLDESSKEPFLHPRDGKLGEFGRGFIV